MEGALDRKRRGWLPLLALAGAALACDSGTHPAGPGLPGGPTPPPAGRRTALSASASLDASGGELTLAAAAAGGGALTVVVPPGALAGPATLTLTELAGDGPVGLSGSAYRLEGAGLDAFLLAATLRFTPPSGVAPADVAVAHQDFTGYWFRSYAVSRDASTASVTSTLLGDWALVAIAAQRDLAGVFRLDSAIDRFSASGSVTLQFLGKDGAVGLYAPVGEITIAGTTSVTTAPPSCLVHTATTPVAQQLPLSIAELLPGAWLPGVHPAPAYFRWALNGRWDLDCDDGTHPFVSTSFNTLGFTTVGCSGSYGAWPPAGPAPLLDAAHVQGQYTIDCGAQGTVTAVWDLVEPPALPGPLP